MDALATALERRDVLLVACILGAVVVYLCIKAVGLAAADAPAAPAPAGGRKAHGPATVLGANQAWRDEASLPEYSVEDVRKHASREDAWVVIDGKVYDVSPFVEDHPGGDSILNHVGGDASAGFHGPQHPDHVLETVRKYLIGRLSTGQ